MASSFFKHALGLQNSVLSTYIANKTTRLGKPDRWGSQLDQVGVRIAVCLAALCLVVLRTAAVDPRFPPGFNFDLSHWYLTIPDAEASTISPVQLSAGFTNAYFETGTDGAMVFSCPVTGGTTSGSDFPRCELRELLDPNDNRINWSGFGRHVITAQCKVTQVPSSRRVVIGQIHTFQSNALPLLKLTYNNGIIDALVRLQAAVEDDTRLAVTTVGLNSLINYELILRDGLLSATVNGVTRSTNVFLADPAWKQQAHYFKAGNYCQDNSGPTNEMAVVAFYQLKVEHSAPSLISNVSKNGNGLCLTWSSLQDSWYFVQGLTNLMSTNWLTASTNMQATGESTSYCIPLPSPYQFFRIAATTP